MTKYAEGTKAVWLRPNDNQEVAIEIIGYIARGDGDHYQIKLPGGGTHIVQVNEILPSVKPGFDVRDIAFVLDGKHDAIEGKVVAKGIGNDKNVSHLKLRLKDGKDYWYKVGDVFIEQPKLKLNISDKVLKAASSKGPSSPTTSWG